jgi:glycosyltransferase involved in cell wall biosynthesis
VTTIVINGKYTAQRTTGVQRSAACIVAALDRLLSITDVAAAPHWVLACPPHAVLPSLQRIEVRTVGTAGIGLHAWEQLLLPWVARGKLLLNLAGTAPLLQRRQVCTFHDAAVFDRPEVHTWAFGIWYRFVFRRIARQASLLFTVSAFSKSRLVAWLRIAPERVAVLHGSGDHMDALPADAGTLGRLGLEAGSYFVAVGSANPVKNLRALLHAFEAMPERFTGRLVLVGGSNRHVFAAGLPIAENERVLRAGSVSDAELKALYASAIALVFPSTYEGFGLPPLEAMTCGCPVAASGAAAIPEVCGDAVMYFDPAAPATIAAAMLSLFDDSDLRCQLRRRGAARARAFTWDAAARSIIERLNVERSRA